METFLQELEIASGALISLSVTAAALLLLPVIFVVIWKKRCGTAASLIPLFIGVAGFIISVRVLELGVHMLCIVMDNPVSRFINGSTIAYVLYGIFMAGIFEECGRYVFIRFIMKRNKTRENMVMYGIGHGGIEVWAITLLSIVNLLVIVVMLKFLDVQTSLTVLGLSADLPESTLSSVTMLITSAAHYDIASGLLCVFERFCCMFIHISLTIIVAYGIIKNRKLYLPLAVLAHAAVDVLPALSQRGAVGIWAVEAWICVCAVLLTIWCRKLYRKM